MINYIMLYKIRKKVKKILKEKITEGELETTPTSCLGCVADEIIFYLYSSVSLSPLFSPDFCSLSSLF